MNKLIVTAAAIALMAPALASAQDRGGRDGRGGREGGGQYQGSQYQGRDRGQGGFRRGGDAAAPAAAAPVQAAPAAPAAPAVDRRSDRGARGAQASRPGQNTAPTDRRFDGDRGGQRYDNRRGQADRRFDDNRRYDNRGGSAQRGGNFNYRGNSYARFRADPYRWPGGYRGAYSWRPNQFLPRSFLLRDYYIDNYFDFGFSRPPYGYEWIRVGDDALLVNIYTGQIVEVAPGVFYW